MPDVLSKEEIVKLKKIDKQKLIDEKKASMKHTDAFISNIKEVKSANHLLDKVSKDASGNEILVTFVGNTSWVCDSQLDVLTDKAYDYSVSNNGVAIKHLKEHRLSFDNIVGKINNVYVKNVEFDSNIKLDAIVFDSIVSKKNDEKIFEYYKDNEVTQHSIGLRYRDILLAINSSDEEDKEEFAVWSEYYPQIKYNSEAAEKAGYFWVVKDVDIHEVSCVLFGANPLTPTLSVKQDSIQSNIFNIKNKGRNMTMTIEEALSENIKLANEVNQLKADLSVKVAKAKNEEQVRILSLFDAAKTFGISNDTVIKFAKSNVDVEMAVTSFEAIKEAGQLANHVDTSDQSLKANVDKSKAAKTTDTDLSPKDYLLALAKMGKEQDNKFGGLM